MTLPFSRSEFFAVFARYNDARHGPSTFIRHPCSLGDDRKHCRVTARSDGGSFTGRCASHDVHRLGGANVGEPPEIRGTRPPCSGNSELKKTLSMTPNSLSGK